MQCLCAANAKTRDFRAGGNPSFCLMAAPAPKPLEQHFQYWPRTVPALFLTLSGNSRQLLQNIVGLLPKFFLPAQYLLHVLSINPACGVDMLGNLIEIIAGAPQRYLQVSLNGWLTACSPALIFCYRSLLLIRLRRSCSCRPTSSGVSSGTGASNLPIYFR